MGITKLVVCTPLISTRRQRQADHCEAHLKNSRGYTDKLPQKTKINK